MPLLSTKASASILPQQLYEVLMKAGIHPEYNQITVTCTCGNTFATVIWLYSGWMPAFMRTSYSCCGRIEALAFVERSGIATPWTLTCWRDLGNQGQKQGRA